MIDSFQSSSVSETCGNCDRYARENKKLRQKLTSSLEAQEQLRILVRIKKELEGIQLIAAQYDIEMEDLAGAFSFALDTLFAIKSKPLVQKGKDVVHLVKQLFERKENQRKENLLPKEEESSVSVKSEQMKIEERPVPNARIRNSHKDSPTQKVEKKKESQKIDAANHMPTQKQAQIGIFQEMNSYRKKEERLQNPYVPKEPTPSEQKGFTNLDEEHQKLSILNKSASFEEICLPLVWEKRTCLEMSGKTITKRYNDNYKKICTENPLPRSGKHRIMIEMVTNGTVAFGVVTAAFRKEHMIDDRKCDAVKYLSFENGGGLVKMCGEEILSGERVHLNPGQVLEIDFDASIPEVTFRNPNLQKPLPIRLTDRFKNKELYFFLEMKHLNTSVRFL